MTDSLLERCFCILVHNSFILVQQPLQEVNRGKTGHTKTINLVFIRLLHKSTQTHTDKQQQCLTSDQPPLAEDGDLGFSMADFHPGVSGLAGPSPVGSRTGLTGCRHRRNSFLLSPRWAHVTWLRQAELDCLIFPLQMQTPWHTSFCYKIWICKFSTNVICILCENVYFNSTSTHIMSIIWCIFCTLII